MYAIVITQTRSSCMVMSWSYFYAQ